MNANIAINAGLGTYYSLTTVQCIKYYSFEGIETGIKQLRFLCFFLTFSAFFCFKSLLFHGVCLSSNRSVEKQHMWEKIIKHIREIFDITFVDKTLFWVQVLDSRIILQFTILWGCGWRSKLMTLFHENFWINLSNIQQ